MKKKHHYIKLLALLLLIVVLAGCGKKARREIPGPEESFRKAMNLFNRERYYQAQELFKDIALNYSGSAIIDSTKLYLGLTYYYMRDYLTAADEFQRVGQLYPTSPVAPTAQYYLAMSYLEMAPSYALDQKYTVKARDEFQRFLEDYNEHEWKLEARKRLEECRDKLARKEYAASLLYYKMSEYASCVLYSDEVLANYYDTKWAAAAQLLKAKSYLALKDDTKAAEELEKFLAKYTGSKEEAEARALLREIRNRRP